MGQIGQAIPLWRGSPNPVGWQRIYRLGGGGGSPRLAKNKVTKDYGFSYRNAAKGLVGMVLTGMGLGLRRKPGSDLVFTPFTADLRESGQAGNSIGCAGCAAWGGVR